MHDTEYGLDEAQHLIGEAIMASPDSDIKSHIDELQDQAHAKLVADLLKLDKLCKAFFVSRSETPPKPRHPESIKIEFDGVWLLLSLRKGRYVLRWTDGHAAVDEKEVLFDFDPIKVRFEGVEEDTYLAAEPGRPRRKRSPVAVIIEKAFELMRSHPPRR